MTDESSRYVVRDNRSPFRKPSMMNPAWLVVDTATNQIVDELSTKGTATRTARDLNRAPEPTAAVRLVKRYGDRVAVVRAQEPGELPVWTVHLDGERPVYVALTQVDAFRVGSFWARGL